MDEKVMDLLANILEGQNELRGEISEVRSELKQEIQGVSGKLDKLEMRIESEVGCSATGNGTYSQSQIARLRDSWVCRKGVAVF